MDPNEALRRIREIARKVEAGNWMWDSQEEAQAEQEEALYTFLELDRRILSGGFLPREWAKHTHPSTAPLSDDPWINPNAPTHPAPF